MDWLEEELKQALARKEPGAGFDARVRARLHRRPPQWLAIAAAIVVTIGAGEAWQQYRGRVAKEQVMTAMRRQKWRRVAWARSASTRLTPTSAMNEVTMNARSASQKGSCPKSDLVTPYARRS